MAASPISTISAPRSSSRKPWSALHGQIQAEFRSISPGERTQLVNSLKDRITIQESPWVCKIDLLFNTQAKPFDNPKIRQALSMAVDRWTASDALSKITIVKPVAAHSCRGLRSR